MQTILTLPQISLTPLGPPQPLPTLTATKTAKINLTLKMEITNPPALTKQVKEITPIIIVAPQTTHQKIIEE
jgi:hypothetical protein